ncbi:hypothetical protein LO772_07235 [Yinghuangia sp. ASG 101]|uniref:hypothetical protein n=1 Tax=Yinghuangia sp. ASG 101 TaxID=2896848 RepID=UPI001E29B735|nr:hypothetical protein [Yinghuangia sp. ASG 101]UGQ13394.1 hypothetical protein LO772_07235 [Yinghuangia sp. ASG 101]
MSSLLTYEVITNPSPLVAQPGVPSSGTVNVLVTNNHEKSVFWKSIDVTVPVVSDGTELTDDVQAIQPSLLRVDDILDDPTFDAGGSPGVFTAEYRWKGKRRAVEFEPGVSMVLVLADVPVSGAEGLVRLKITEVASGGDPAKSQSTRHHAVWLQKAASKVPANFRAEQTLVDDGDDVRLLWNGPDDLDYQVLMPDGSEASGQFAAGSLPGSHEWSPDAGTGPKRGTTYTLVARTAAETSQGGDQGYFLTTTVHVLDPEFPTVTATTEVITPQITDTVNGARVSFSATGIDIHDAANNRGTLLAGTAELVDVKTTTAEVTAGLTADTATVTTLIAGQAQVTGPLTADTATFTSLTSGTADVTGQFTAATGTLNALTSGTADVTGQLTAATAALNSLTSAQAQVTGQFTADTATLSNVTAAQAQVTGQFTADTATLSNVTAAQVQVTGRLTAAGATITDLDLTRAQVTDRLTLRNGLTVLDGSGNVLLETLDGPPRVVVHGQLDAQGALNAHGKTTVTGVLAANDNVYINGVVNIDNDLKVQHNMRVAGKVQTGELTVRGHLQANAHLTVRRDGGDWIFRTHHDRVVANAGNFHVMGMISCRSREWEQH